MATVLMRASVISDKRGAKLRADHVGAACYMIGLEDGIVDGLFRFSRPLATSYYWCPPLRASALDLRALGIDS